MSTQDGRFPKGAFGNSPVYAARIADLTNAVIPGGREFVQQLFRAKQEALKGVAHLVDAQIQELAHIDSAIEDRAKQPPVSPAQHAQAASHPPKPGMSLSDVLKQASDLFMSKRPKSASGATVPAACARPSDRRAPLPAPGPVASGGAAECPVTSSSTSATSAEVSPAPEPLEKISIS
ncbi:hypothetical protein [Comamonas sp. JC664]|uniref:hypothetical protein n=1 Tax=Comamonas sp. JC664 TaxID=2801917 RepID=UPI00174977B4|nr:hypothetical protein [Comamonas sp. JC664]MBL0694024.1 hypothetical protein [Comamonas sp. JC664]GHG75431.1 hypothetical protein GCM10012319_23530 [Comamonas sp. KCTC 72670]